MTPKWLRTPKSTAFSACPWTSFYLSSFFFASRFSTVELIYGSSVQLFLVVMDDFVEGGVEIGKQSWRLVLDMNRSNVLKSYPNSIGAVLDKREVV